VCVVSTPAARAVTQGSRLSRDKSDPPICSSMTAEVPALSAGLARHFKELP
jgi:hypothetical protein